jgi:penicillin-binding protein 1C
MSIKHRIYRLTANRQRLHIVLWRAFIPLAVIQILLIGFYFSVRWPLFDDPYSLTLLDRQGALLGATVAADQQWRFAPQKQVPQKLAQAMIWSEDKRFYSHAGVDPVAVARAIWQNLKAKRVVSGASTLSMQVIRLSRKGQPRTLGEKALEAVMALRLEMSASKDRILSLYAAHAPFGGNVVGFAAAAWRYFGRPPEQLSWAEAAFLAVLPNRPGLVHPGRNRKQLFKRRNRLLHTLVQKGALDDLTCRLAQSESIPKRPQPIPRTAPHLLFRARHEIAKSGPVRTTVKKTIQTRANKIVSRHLRELAQSGIHNAGALIVEVENGQVLAYVGNDPNPGHGRHESYVDVVGARRSSGSIFKPLLYATMLDAGELLPTRLVADIPTRMEGFKPENYSRQYRGAVPAWLALARSLNIPAVRMLQSYGLDRFYAQLKALGITTLHRPAEKYGLTLILGGAETTLWDITGIYAGLARSVNRAGRIAAGASFFGPHYILKKEPENVLSPALNKAPLTAAACWQTLEAMLQVTRPGVESAWRDFESGRKIAWKTGTSYGYRDAWAVGVTPRFAVGVWVGNADGEGRPGLTGIGAAAPLLFDLFDILDDQTWFEQPLQQMRMIEVCSRSGYPAGPNCAHKTDVWMPARAAGSPPCPYCRTVSVDAQKTFRVHSRCASMDDIESVSWFVLPPAMAWYYGRHNAEYSLLPPLRNDCRRGIEKDSVSALTLIYPPLNSQMYLPTELTGRRQEVIFEAAHRKPNTRLYWHLDKTYLGATKDIHTMHLAPGPGLHTITLVDEDGEQLVRRFTVLEKKKT